MSLSIEYAFVNLLTNTAAVTAVVGSRIYPGFAVSTAVKPYVIYEFVSDEIRHTLSAPSSELTTRSRIQLDIYANLYSQVKQIDAALLYAANRFRGKQTVGTASVFIQRCMRDDSSDNAIEPIHDGDSPIYHAAQQYWCYYNRSTTP